MSASICRPPDTMAAMARASVERVEFGLNIGVLSSKPVTSRASDERSASWELYGKLATRVAVAPLNPSLLREALPNCHSLFATTRGILRAAAHVEAWSTLASCGGRLSRPGRDWSPTQTWWLTR